MSRGVFGHIAERAELDPDRRYDNGFVRKLEEMMPDPFHPGVRPDVGRSGAPGRTGADQLAEDPSDVAAVDFVDELVGFLPPGPYP